MIRWLALAYGCTFGTLLVLKFLGLISLSWWAVTLPLTIPLLLTIGAVVGLYVALTKRGSEF